MGPGLGAPTSLGSGVPLTPAPAGSSDDPGSGPSAASSPADGGEQVGPARKAERLEERGCWNCAPTGSRKATSFLLGDKEAAPSPPTGSCPGLPPQSPPCRPPLPRSGWPHLEEPAGQPAPRGDSARKATDWALLDLGPGPGVAPGLCCPGFRGQGWGPELGGSFPGPDTVSRQSQW